MKGDILFWVLAIFGLGAWILSSQFLATISGIPYIVIALVLAGLIWLILDFFEKRMIRDLNDVDENIIFCNFDSAINASDYLIDDELTILSLSEMGLSPETAMGKTLPMYGETIDGDIYFEGTILYHDGQYVIRKIREFKK